MSLLTEFTDVSVLDLMPLGFYEQSDSLVLLGISV